MSLQPGPMNPDLAKERAHCPFSKEEMTHLMDGGQDKTAERRKVQKLYFEHPEVSLPTSRPWMLIAFYHYASSRSIKQNFPRTFTLRLFGALIGQSIFPGNQNVPNQRSVNLGGNFV